MISIARNYKFGLCVMTEAGYSFCIGNFYHYMQSLKTPHKDD